MPSRLPFPPALAYGNTVVFKPTELAPASAWVLADILKRAGVLCGVFNLVMGRGSVVGEAFVNSADVSAISFTGSVATGRAIAAKAVARMAKFQLEMGGKNPLIVLDAAALDIAVNVAAQGSYFSTGRRCTASSRLIVTDGIHDRFVAALTEKLKQLKVDDALKSGTDSRALLLTDLDVLQINIELALIDHRPENWRLAASASSEQPRATISRLPYLSTRSRVCALPEKRFSARSPALFAPAITPPLSNSPTTRSLGCRAAS
jgi:Aldehyde dehydrogenase family